MADPAASAALGAPACLSGIAPCDCERVGDRLTRADAHLVGRLPLEHDVRDSTVVLGDVELDKAAVHSSARW